MRYREFENHIRENFDENEVAIDLAALQSSIQSKLEKKRRFPFLWMFGSTIGVTALGMLLFTLSSKSETINNAIQTKPTSIENYSNVKNVKNASQQVFSTIQNAESLDVEDNIAVTNSSPKTIDTNTTSKNIINHSSKNYNTHIQSSTLPSILNADYSTVSADKSVFNVSNANSKYSDTGEKIKGDISMIKMAEMAEMAENIAISSEKANITIAIENTDQEAVKRDYSSLALLPSYSLGNIKSINPFTLKGKEILCPTFDRKGKILLSFIPEVGYFIPIKKLAAKQADLPNGVFSLRYDNEESLEGISAGAHIKIGKSELPFYFKGGVVMSRITEKMKLSYTTIKRDTTIGIVSITKSPNGDTITTIYGPIVKETETTGLNTKHYYLHLFDLPISVGIEQKLGNLKLCAEVGAAFNVGLSTTGNILTTDDNYEDIKQGGKFKSSIGINYFGSFGVEMPMSEKISLYGNLRARYLPTDFTRADGTISQRYNTIGLNVGVVYSIK